MSQIVMADLSTVELDPTPIPSDWILEGAPRALAKVLAISKDGATWVMVWDCSAGRFRWLYSEDEIVHITSGEVIITEDHGGKELHLTKGDMIFFPAGAACTWRVPVHVRKLAVLHRTMPTPLRLAWGMARRLQRIVYSHQSPLPG